MAPSGHSSSSHSSHSSSSHSSRSSSSSSRSYSSSRSSGSSSRSYSSSRSSGNSSRSSGSFGSRPSSSRGPSGHSTSSHSSRPAPQSAPRPNRPASPPPPRSRRNQPEGFRISGTSRPSYFRGARHDYIYYPVAWVDESTGRNYESGYYDENGERYDNVAFEKNGTYENVVCKCEYCGQDAVVNLKAEEAGVRSVQCPNCGAPMSIRSELDEALSQPAENTHTYASEESLKGFFEDKKKKKAPIGIILLLVLVLLGIGRSWARMKDASMFQQETTQQLVLQEEDRIYLSYTGSGAYSTVSEGQGADKTLVWDAAEDSYYDADSDCWLWYNTDVNPPIWQYWYEGISSDFGDYGWMEHDADGWWIERDAGDWIALPDRYDTSGLWYIDD